MRACKQAGLYPFDYPVEMPAIFLADTLLEDTWLNPYEIVERITEHKLAMDNIPGYKRKFYDFFARIKKSENSTYVAGLQDSYPTQSFDLVTQMTAIVSATDTPSRVDVPAKSETSSGRSHTDTTSHHSYSSCGSSSSHSSHSTHSCSTHSCSSHSCGSSCGSS